MTQLTDNQRALILLAVETEGRIEKFPDNLKGGARASVTRGLLVLGLVQAQGAGYALTEAGFQAVGVQPPDAGEAQGEQNHGGSDEREADAESDADTDADGQGQNAADADGEPDHVGDEETAASTKPAAPPKQRKETRIDQVVALLLRPQGATIAEVMEATDWQQHSVRGFFAGTLRKKGYTVINTKKGKEDRIYRIQTEETTEAERAAATAPRDEDE